MQEFEAKEVKIIKRHKLILLLLIAAVVLSRCGSGGADRTDTRPRHWAAAVERQGLPNLYKVSPDLYRGAQPEKSGIEELKKLGIKTIINFRTSNEDQRLIKGYTFNYFHLPMNAFFPGKEKFSRFLEIVSDPAMVPVFIHCKHGADRTGAAAALYRINIQQWDPDEAINEMVNGGYHFHKIHNHLKNFVKELSSLRSQLE
jgi:protein tyrosine/serine phosphatase